MKAFGSESKGKFLFTEGTVYIMVYILVMCKCVAVYSNCYHYHFVGTAVLLDILFLFVLELSPQLLKEKRGGFLITELSSQNQATIVKKCSGQYGVLQHALKYRDRCF